MRALVALFVLCCAVAAAPRSAGAEEKVKTNQTTEVYARKGERAKVLLTVKRGQRMKVIAKEDRWLRVRVAGRTGWVPRSKVDVAEEIARNTRRRAFVDGRGTKRGFNGEEGPSDRIGADAVGEGVEPDEEGGSRGSDRGEEEDDDGGARPRAAKGGQARDGGGDDEDAVVVDDEDGDSLVIEEDEETARATARVRTKTVALLEPDDDAEESFAATPKTVLYPTGTKQGKYTEVENSEGELGYVLTSALELQEAGGGGGAAIKGRAIEARARLGFSFISQRMATVGGVAMQPDNYALSTSALTIALGGSLLYPYKARFVVGGEGTYDLARAVPGIKVMGGNTGLSLHNLRLRGLAGYDLRRKNGLMLYGRLGFHYQSYQVSNVGDLAKNTAKLPSEIVTSPAIGVGVAIPRLTKKIAVRASLDTMLVGTSVKQTKGLEDGTEPGGSGFILGATMVYEWRKDYDIIAAYDLTLFSMSFGAPLAGSQRGHMGTSVSRSDVFHALTVGLVRGF